MGNCLPRPIQSSPIDSSFSFPNPILTWPQGDGFASGTIDLGGLQVCQITSFTKVWAAYEGGLDNLGATFFEPSSIPDGFFMLGSYSQPNNQPLFGWVLAGKDNTNNTSDGTLSQPTDYTLVWSSESLKINQDGPAYIWLPTPPNGYTALGHVVTTSPDKPALDKIRCVRSDFTDECEAYQWIWGLGTQSNDGFNVYSLRPRTRGTQALGVPVGTFIVQNSGDAASVISLSCLKNNNFGTFSSMPNQSQIQALFEAYSPLIYFHPREIYLPCSVNWLFDNGALLYQRGEESNPVTISPNGSNLPQGGSNDDAYWLDLPIDDNSARERVQSGDLQSSEAYLHIKPMLGATFTDIALWIFYPFNGPSRAKLVLIEEIPLGRIGEHVGDWEHMTLRISNFNGILNSVFLSQHSGGEWVDASSLEFQNGTNKPVAYSSLNGHAFYSEPGLVMQGTDVIGIRNDTAMSNMMMDTGARYSVVAAEYISAIVEPPWLNYARKWGPNITYELGSEVEHVENSLNGDVRSEFERLVNLIPDEVLGEEGPTGPRMKNNWNGDEV